MSGLTYRRVTRCPAPAAVAVAIYSRPPSPLATVRHTANHQLANQEEVSSSSSSTAGSNINACSAAPILFVLVGYQGGGDSYRPILFRLLCQVDN